MDRTGRQRCMCLVVGFLLVGVATAEESSPRPPGERPLITKVGTIDCGLLESTPIVFRDRLYRFESVRHDYKKGFCPPEVRREKPGAYFRFIDEESHVTTPRFARECHMGSAIVRDDTMFVFGTAPGRRRIQVFWSKDLRAWSDELALTLPDSWTIFNTSVCEGRDGYVMAIEMNGPKEEVGVYFTQRFAVSDDLLTWRLLPVEYVYTQEAYTACAALRYVNGFYYMFYGYREYLQQPPFERMDTRIVRSRDLARWESSPLNPVLRYSEQDKVIASTELTAEQRAYITGTKFKKTSDFDLCEFEGKTVIYYSWGGNAGRQFLARAEYDGTVQELLTGFFPDQ